MGAGATSGDVGTSYYCHRCQTMLEQLGDGGTCPNCRGGFVEESANAMALAQAVHWLVTEDSSSSSTEARIAGLLDDLREHLSTVEGLRGTIVRGMDSPDTPKVEPAPPEVFNGIVEVCLDSLMIEEMRQTPQCVICCSDFEAGELLSKLPGCGHLFHGRCIRTWLERAANCPICRCDLCRAVDFERTAMSTASSVILDTDRSQYTDRLSSQSTLMGALSSVAGGRMGSAGLRLVPGAALPTGQASAGTSSERDLASHEEESGDSSSWQPAGAHASPLQSYSPRAELFRPSTTGASAGGPSLGPGGGGGGSDGSSPTPPPRPPGPPPPRRGTSSVLVGAGSVITSPTGRRPSRPPSMAEARPR